MSKYARRLEVVRAELLLKDFPHKPKVATNFAMRRGQLYEEAIRAKLELQYGRQFVAGLWFHYVERSGKHGAVQIDGLLIDLSQGIIYIIEVKHSHTHVAWLQMRNFYYPVLQAAFGIKADGGVSPLTSVGCPSPRRSCGVIGGEEEFSGKFSPSPLWRFKFVEVCNVYDADENMWLKGEVGVAKICGVEEARVGEFNILQVRRGRR